MTEVAIENKPIGREKTLKLRMCEICQQLNQIENLETLIKTLSECASVEKYAYIIHDQDKAENGDLKAPHIHIFIKFKYSYDALKLGKKLGIQAQYVQKIKSRRFEDALLYLTHSNAPDKHQYPAESVTANFNYKKTCEEYIAKKELLKNKVSDKELLNYFIGEIIEGNIKRFNYHEHIDPVFFTKNYATFQNAFKTYNDLVSLKERNMEVMYFTGGSGTGKTTMAKKIAADKGLTYYVSSSSNDILDGYRGQDCLILDDLRPSSLGLADLLKLLDNHTSSTSKSRYYNKVLECKLIIITTVVDVDEFFKNVFKEESEPLTQLKRRCKTYFKFKKEVIDTYYYDEEKEDYIFIEGIANPINSLFPKTALNKETALQEIQNLFGDSYKKVSNTANEWLELGDSELPFD